MSSLPGWHLTLAAPRTLRFGSLVLLLLMVNRINDPLLDATLGQAFLWTDHPITSLQDTEATKEELADG